MAASTFSIAFQVARTVPSRRADCESTIMETCSETPLSADASTAARSFASILMARNTLCTPSDAETDFHLIGFWRWTKIPCTAQQAGADWATATRVSERSSE